MRAQFRGLSRLSAVRAGARVSTLSTASRALSTLQLEDEETQWRHRHEGQYGEGNYPLFRALYKELCDEVRREFYTKPPPPFNGANSPSAATATAAEAEPEATVTTQRTASPDTEASEALSGSLPSRPSVVYGNGSWRVEYRPENNVVLFRRDAVRDSRMARVVAYARVAVQDPPRLNAMLTFADWYPFEILIERKGVIVHFSVACNEGGMHMRNCRVYDAKALDHLHSGSDDAPTTSSSPLPDAETTETADESVCGTDAVLGVTDDAEWVRQNLLYDGPCLWHLELSFQNELYDVMQDHGVDLDWLRWGSEWVFYLEHFVYTRWCLGMLDNLIPPTMRGGEEDFLLPHEQAELDEPAEDWLAPHAT